MNNETTFINQLNTACLFQLSYYIESNKEAAIIDPMREYQPYIDFIESRGAKLKYIMLTHFHNDFVSGHLDLAAKTGATIIYGTSYSLSKSNNIYKVVESNKLIIHQNWSKTYYKKDAYNSSFSVNVVKDEEELALGYINIKCISTPGHTAESICYAIIGNNNKISTLFTGDSLLIGTIAGPDISQIKDSTPRDLGILTYLSLKKLILKADESTIIYPGHSGGLGNFIAKNIKNNVLTSTFEKQNLENIYLNYLINNQDKLEVQIEKFIDLLLENNILPPQHVYTTVKYNLHGYEPLDESISQLCKPIRMQDIFDKNNDKNDVQLIDKETNSSDEHNNCNNKTKLANNNTNNQDSFLNAEFKSLKNGISLLDTRDQDSIIKGYIPDSIAVPLKCNFSRWTGTIFKPSEHILIICEEGKEKEAVIRLLRIGYYNIIGYLKGGFNRYTKYNLPINKIDLVEKEAIIKYIFNNQNLLLDIRENEEHVSGSHNVSLCWPLSELENHIEFFDKLKKEAQTNNEKEKQIYIFCKSGNRALIGITILNKLKFKNLTLLAGGIDAIVDAGIKFSKD